MPPMIRKGRRQRPRKTLIYGVEGIGKSTLAAGCPGVIFLPTENGVDDIDCESFEPTTNYEASIEALGWLAESDHKYEGVAVDSADWLLRYASEYLCRTNNVKSIEDLGGGYGKGHPMLAEFWASKVLKTLDYLHQQRGMAVILIAHAAVRPFNDPRSSPYDRYAPAFPENPKHPQASIGNMLREWCDEVLFCNYKVYTKTEETGFNKARTTAQGSGDRVLFTTEKPTHLAKNRLGMPDEIPLTWSDYASYWPKGGESA